MTQNQLIQEYEFDPTLTTSEVNALIAEREEREYMARMEAVGIIAFEQYEIFGIKPVELAEHFNGDADAMLAFISSHIRQQFWIGDNSVYVSASYAEMREWERQAEEDIKRAQKDLDEAIAEFQANPCEQKAYTITAVSEFLSDLYKEKDGMRWWHLPYFNGYEEYARIGNDEGYFDRYCAWLNSLPHA